MSLVICMDQVDDYKCYASSETFKLFETCTQILSDFITSNFEQVTLSGNQQPVRTEITEAAMELGAEVSFLVLVHHCFSLNSTFICLRDRFLFKFWSYFNKMCA